MWYRTELARRSLVILAGAAELWFGSTCHRTQHVPLSALGARVEYAGCAIVLDGPVCLFTPGQSLVLWVQTEDHQARVVLMLDSQGLKTQARPVGGGRQYVAEPLAGGTRLTVTVSQAGKTGVWTLHLRGHSPYPLLAEAEELRRAGEQEAAQQLLKRELQRIPARHKGRALGLLARLARDSGDNKLAIDHLRAAVEHHRAAGDLSARTDDVGMLVHLLMVSGRFEQAWGRLDELAGENTGWGEAGFVTSYLRGLLAKRTGDLRTAVESLQRAVEKADRVQLGFMGRAARQVLAGRLHLLGRHQEAETLFQELLETTTGEHGCERVLLLDQIAWSRLLRLEAGGSGAEEAVALLHEAREQLDQSCFTEPQERFNLQINLALAHLHAGRFDEALRLLDGLASLGPDPDPRYHLWELDLRGRISLAKGEAERALDLYERLAKLARATLEPRTRWRSWVGRAQAYAALHRPEEALRCFAQAEQLTRSALLQVALGQGRALFVAQHQQGVKAHIELLLDLGRAEQAMTVARQARIQGLASMWRIEQLAELDQAARHRWNQAITAYQQLREQLEKEHAQAWRLPADQLKLHNQRADASSRRLLGLLDRAQAVLDNDPGTRIWQAPLPKPRPGQLDLLYFPLARGWVGFAADRTATVSNRLGPLSRRASAEDLSQSLLQPFRERIEAATSVRILASGWLQEVDFHALPWGSGALGEQRLVLYGLDLPWPSSTLPSSNRQRALVVADPRLDLPAARQDAQRVVADLRQEPKSWQVTLLEGTQVTGSRLREELPTVELFHYAGHGQYGGSTGFASALHLAEGATFSTGDVLALPGVPRSVVLLGCETARAAEAVGPSLGLAQAFLLAGSERVVAASRPLDDALAASVTDGLYLSGEGAFSSLPDLGRALARLRKDQPDMDWASLRVLVP